MMTPPRNTPAVPPAGAAAPYRASAFGSSFGLAPKSMNSNVRAEGAISAAPAPWTARPVSSVATLPASPASNGADDQDDPAGGEHPARTEHVGELAAEQKQPAEGDDVGVEDPGQVLLGEPEVAPASAGSATPMIEVSMMTMNWAAAITASPSQRRSAAGCVVVDISTPSVGVR